MAETQELQQWHVTEPYLETHCSLGEGPFYEPATNSVRFVDIIKQRLHIVSLTEGPSSLKTLQFSEAVTVTADIEGRDPKDAVLIGAKQGLAVLDRNTGTYEYVTKFDDEKAQRIRSNDGVVDPNGRFWLGTMTDFGLGPFQPEGSLYRFASNSPATRTRSGLTIPNSVGFSPDSRTMYFTHSTAREVFAWDYDPADGAFSNERVFYRHVGPGEPDGFRVDTQGNLWHAVYGESRVLKITPQGKLVGEVKIPTRNATCCELVGGGEMVITTAGDDEGEGESKRLGGAVFKVQVGAEGTPRFAFKLE
ncbi:hypothetical protein C8A05DRAFT_34988 [Staphylotrichum tortipilum]|uniref:SMP-30/Gluconolactonase/LRE-like region domain-containing protein n=1 Tax=Staphylotrichum tortipilum TaxID=2831512 RepID=A0AAN6MI75_9PEZI|nr:hypothetical protein C8A05DRAFT_34988 [Staphylotrichum longicolle]